MRVIEDLASLAPLHNRPALDVIDAMGQIGPGVPQVAAFDTAFMPPCRRTPTSTPCPTSGTNSGGYGGSGSTA